MKNVFKMYLIPLYFLHNQQKYGIMYCVGLVYNFTEFKIEFVNKLLLYPQSSSYVICLFFHQ